MVCARRVLEVIEAENLPAHAADARDYLRTRLGQLADEFPGVVLDVRGSGLMCAFSLPTQDERDALIRRLWERRTIMLASGVDSGRFRPALTVSRAELDAAVDAVRAALR